MKKYINFLLIFVLISSFVITLSMYVVASEYTQFNTYLLVWTVFLFLVYLIFHRKWIKRVVASHFFKKLMSNGLTLVLIFFILGMVNFLVLKNDWTADFTQTKLNTLSDQSKKVMKQLASEPLSMTLFAKREDWSRYLKLLNLYKYENSKVELDAVDVDLKPELVKLYGVEQNGTLLVQYKGKEYLSVIKDELSVTNLLIKVLRSKTPVLYFVHGHNELDLADKSLNGGSYLHSVLKGANYEMRSHDLSYQVPADADVVLIINPVNSFLDKELKNLEKYLSKGGAAVVTFAPQFSQLLVSNLVELLAQFGAKFVNGLVLDKLAASQGGEASIPIINNYSENPITKNFKGRTVFPVSGFFTFPQGSYKWEKIIQTTHFPASWGETSFEEVKQGRATYQSNRDFKGPLTLMTIGEYKQSKLVLWSSSAFLTNQFQGQANNYNLFLNSLGWLVGEENLSSIDRPELSGELVYISDIHLSLIFYLVILLFPFLFFGLSIYSYKRKMSR